MRLIKVLQATNCPLYAYKELCDAVLSQLLVSSLKTTLLPSPCALRVLLHSRDISLGVTAVLRDVFADCWRDLSGVGANGQNPSNEPSFGLH